MLERTKNQTSQSQSSRSRMESLLRVYSNTSPAPGTRIEEPAEERLQAYAAPVYARSIGRDRYLLFRSHHLSRTRVMLSCRDASLVPFIPGISILELTVMLHPADEAPLKPDRVTLLAKYVGFSEASEGVAPGLELSIVQAAPEDSARWFAFLA